MRNIGLLVAATTTLLFTSPSVAQTTGPSIRVCLVGHNERAGQARYRLRVDWEGMKPGIFARIDLAARDGSDATWPQFHSNNRLRPSGRETVIDFFVSDNSQYPLEMFLIGMTDPLPREFDQDCKTDGFCSLKLPIDDVEELGEGVFITSPDEAPPCKSVED
jgi:hypothetical protein